MKITRIPRSRINEVDFDHLSFGETFSDHMFDVEYRDGRWGEPQILPFGNIELSPALTTLHYGQSIFEGMKAFHAADGSIRIFRPEKHHERFNRSGYRVCIPPVDYELFISGIDELVALDREWVPKRRGAALYIRPFIFGSEAHVGLRVSELYRFMIITSPVASYYKEGMNPVRLITETQYVRSAPGGTGDVKTAGNYAASLLPAEQSKKKGFTQVIWLDPVERRYVEEVGTMNIFFVIGDELITPALAGTILAGVTRDTVLQLAREWGIKVSERRIAIEEVVAAAAAGTLREVFGTGTAAVISPVGEIQHLDKLIVVNEGRIGALAQRFYDEITGIQYGERPDPHGWCYTVGSRARV